MPKSDWNLISALRDRFRITKSCLRVLEGTWKLQKKNHKENHSQSSSWRHCLCFVAPASCRHRFAPILINRPSRSRAAHFLKSVPVWNSEFRKRHFSLQRQLTTACWSLSNAAWFSSNYAESSKHHLQYTNANSCENAMLFHTWLLPHSHPTTRMNCLANATVPILH